MKQQLGKLRLEQPFAEMVARSAFTELPVSLRATIVSHDRAFEPYGVPMIWT